MLLEEGGGRFFRKEKGGSRGEVGEDTAIGKRKKSGFLFRRRLKGGRPGRSEGGYRSGKTGKVYRPSEGKNRCPCPASIAKKREKSRSFIEKRSSLTFRPGVCERGKGGGGVWKEKLLGRGTGSQSRTPGEENFCVGGKPGPGTPGGKGVVKWT